MKTELINQSLSAIVPEELLQVVLKLQELREPVNKYMDGLKELTEDEMKSKKWDRADGVISHINLAIVDLVDLLSMELACKIID